MIRHKPTGRYLSYRTGASSGHKYFLCKEGKFGKIWKRKSDITCIIGHEAQPDSDALVESIWQDTSELEIVRCEITVIEDSGVDLDLFMIKSI